MSRAVRSAVGQLGSLGRAAASVSPAVDAGLADRRQFLLTQRLRVEGRDIVLELLDPAGADDQGRHAFVAQRPGQRHLRQRLTASARDVIEAADAREVVLAEEAVSE